ncbi:hypothetical protein CEXT_266061 [Caerostris extrusa]|uniref:C2H2-type domain-containing protein n=1 Tax=Caerostris extrusa TaxID=172846 RepID=A0AAV4TUZ9_CAEEX|nr:hypothetical protein CEXT_266061 [Caerostris extrusa]
MSKDEKKFDSFGEISKDKEEKLSLPETLLGAPAGRNVQNQLAIGNGRDGSHEPSSGNMQNRPRTRNVMLNEPSSGLFQRISGPRNHTSFDVGAEGGQNVVRSSENVQKSAEYFSFQPTSNKRNIAITQDSLSGCSTRNKKLRYFEINSNESSCQPLDLSIRGASYKTDGISGGENSSFQKIQSNISTSSIECSSSVCDVCSKEYSSVPSLNRHMLIHSAQNPFVCKTCQRPFYQSSHLEVHMLVHTGEKPHICEICQRTFTQSSSLKSHKVIHSGTKPHRCDYCYYQAAQKPSLNTHLKRYHSEHKQKCSVCCDYFYSKESLKSHKCKKKYIQ